MKESRCQLGSMGIVYKDPPSSKNDPKFGMLIFHSISGRWILCPELDKVPIVVGIPTSTIGESAGI